MWIAKEMIVYEKEKSVSVTFSGGHGFFYDGKYGSRIGSSL